MKETESSMDVLLLPELEKNPKNDTQGCFTEHTCRLLRETDPIMG